MPKNLTNIQKFFGESVTECGYGWSTRPEVIRDLDSGIVYDNRRTKGLFRHGFYRDTISRYYGVIPDEKVETLIQPLIEDGHLTLMPDGKKTTDNEMRTEWRYAANKTFTVQTKGVSDEFRTGVVVRNSVNGGWALSMMVDTYRMICTNGLMGWGPESVLRAIHYGPIDEKISYIRENVGKILEASNNAWMALQGITEIDATVELMQYLVDKTNISKNWLPDWLSIDESKYKVLGLRGGSHTMYEAVNDITYKLTRSDVKHREHKEVEGSLTFTTRGEFERNLSKAVVLIAEAKGVPTGRGGHRRI